MHPSLRDAPEPLTDGSTVYWSRIFPTLWSALVGVVVVLAWTGELGPAPEGVKWALTAGWGVLSAFFFSLLGGLRQVWLDGDHLVVGDARRGTRIPLSDVLEVRESRFQQVKTVTLRFSRPTPVGTRLRFIPRGVKTFFFPYASSPVARDLRERVEGLLLPR